MKVVMHGLLALRTKTRYRFPQRGNRARSHSRRPAPFIKGAGHPARSNCETVFLVKRQLADIADKMSFYDA